MNNRIEIRQTLTRLLPKKILKEMAKETQALQRQRKVDITSLFWTLILGFSTGSFRTFVQLKRQYCSLTGITLSSSSFSVRFNQHFVDFLKAILALLLEKLAKPWGNLQGTLKDFSDLLLIDSSIIKLSEWLFDDFPGLGNAKSAAKLNLVLSVSGKGPQSVKVTSARRAERKLLSVGKWVKDKLLLMDLGYYDYQLFARIKENGGYFVSRVKANANPVIVRDNLDRGSQFEGQHLQDILPLYPDEELDMVMEFSFKRRRYRGKQKQAKIRFRVIGIWDEVENQYHLYLTNINHLTAKEIGSIYRARWCVELIFREIKSDYGLKDLSALKKESAEALIYACVITLLVSRALLEKVRKIYSAHARGFKNGRWASFFRDIAKDVLRIVVWKPLETKVLVKHLENILAYEAYDPNVRRLSLLEEVEMGYYYGDVEL